MPTHLRLRLAALMFLHCAVGGAWLPIFALYLQQDMHFSVRQVATIFGVMPVARMVAPLIGGQLADRHFALQRLLGVLYLLGGVVLWLMAGHAGFGLFAAWVFLYSMLGCQVESLSTALTFRHLPDPARDFGPVRVWGTIGWIVSGFVLSGWRWLHGSQGGSDSLQLAAGISVLVGIFCFTLPHTPPIRNGNPWAFVEAFRLLRNRNFVVFMGLAFVASSQLQYFSQISAPYLHRLGVSGASLPLAFTIGQWSEIVAMAVLMPLAVPRLGIRNCLLIGALAWPLRCLIYATGPLWLILASLALNGISFTFFSIVGQVYVNDVAGKDIRASAQSLLMLVTSGLGSCLGAFLAGAVQAHFTVGAGALANVDYSRVFLVPAGVLLAGVVVFAVLFREPKRAL